MLSSSENCARTPPAARLVEPEASESRSINSTSRIPASARWNAMLVPMAPPPTTTASACPGISTDPSYRLAGFQPRRLTANGHMYPLRPREPRRCAVLQLLRRAARRRSSVRPRGAKDGDRAVLRRGRLDRARRAVRPGGAARHDGPVLRGRAGAGRAPRRQRREGDRRRAGGGVRHPGGARGRRAAGGAGGARDARRGAGDGRAAGPHRRQHRRRARARYRPSLESLVVGDAVNVAARLEQAAAPGEVLVGEATWALVGHAVRRRAGARRSPPRASSEPLVAWRLERGRSRRRRPAPAARPADRRPRVGARAAVAGRFERSQPGRPAAPGDGARPARHRQVAARLRAALGWPTASRR